MTTILFAMKRKTGNLNKGEEIGKINKFNKAFLRSSAAISFNKIQNITKGYHLSLRKKNCGSQVM